MTDVDGDEYNCKFVSEKRQTLSNIS